MKIEHSLVSPHPEPHTSTHPTPTILQVAEMRATSEHTLRGQAELASVALQARVAALEAECTNLRNANQELFRAKSDAEEQRDSAVG